MLGIPVYDPDADNDRRRNARSENGTLVVHSIGGYLGFATDQIPNIICERTGWGFSDCPIPEPPFEEIANGVAQLWKQSPQSFRREFCNSAIKDNPHPGSIEGGGTGTFKHPSPHKVQLLLEALDEESMHEWCLDEYTSDDEYASESSC